MNREQKLALIYLTVTAVGGIASNVAKELHVRKGIKARVNARGVAANTLPEDQAIDIRIEFENIIKDL